MSHNTFGVGTVPPLPPPRPPLPGYSPHPPGPPEKTDRHRWPVLLTAGTIGAVVASAIAVVITVQARDTSAPAVTQAPSPITVTVAAPTRPAPAPLPTSQADRQTCQQGWVPAGKLIDSATAALNVLPQGMKINDPAVQTNPDWVAAVVKAGGFYRQASDALETQIAPGASPILFEAANTAAKALRSLGDATSAPGDINGNAFDIANEAAAQVGVLCTRLAP
jgi:hypothetical protein